MKRLLYAWRVLRPGIEPSAEEIADYLRDTRGIRQSEAKRMLLADVVRLLEADAAGETKAAEPTAAHSTDFRSVRWCGELYSFTASQAAVVRVLYANWKVGTPDVGDETLLAAVDPEAPPARLFTLFRSHPAWGTMIVQGGSKGTHRIADRRKKS